MKQLRPYQADDVKRMVAMRRFALWEEPGLGKTLSAIHAAAQHKPVLVVCPAYIVPQWADEIAEAYPSDTIAYSTGSMVDRRLMLTQEADWTIASIELVREPTQFVRSYQTLVLDEAHHYRGRTSQQTKGAQALADRIPYVYELTGTPIKNEADDLFALLRILDKRRFSSYERFEKDYCRVVSNGFSNRVKGLRNERALRQVLDEYRTRRTYKSTGLRRPEPIERTIVVPPPPLWKKVYDSIRTNYRLLAITFTSAPAMLMALRALTLEQKIPTARAIAEDHPDCLFFVYYRESAAKLGDALKLPIITGAMSPHKRSAAAKATTSAVVTVASLSEGVDLTHFGAVAFIEDDYLPGTRTQAVDRVVRWSQDNTGRSVFVFNVRVKGTIDERIAGISSRRNADMVAILREEVGLDPIGTIVGAVKSALVRS